MTTYRFNYSAVYPSPKVFTGHESRSVINIESNAAITIREGEIWVDFLHPSTNGRRKLGEIVTIDGTLSFFPLSGMDSKTGIGSITLILIAEMIRDITPQTEKDN